MIDDSEVLCKSNDRQKSDRWDDILAVHRTSGCVEGRMNGPLIPSLHSPIGTTSLPIKFH